MQETEETYVQSLGLEDALEESMATHSSILAWEIAWQATVNRVVLNLTWPKWLSKHTHTIINYMCQKYQVLGQTSV